MRIIRARVYIHNMNTSELILNNQELLTKYYPCQPRYKAYIVADNILVDVNSVNVKNQYITYSGGWCRIQDCILLESLQVADNHDNWLYEGDILSNHNGSTYIIRAVRSDLFVGWVLIDEHHDAIVNWSPKDYTCVDNVYSNESYKCTSVA